MNKLRVLIPFIAFFFLWEVSANFDLRKLVRGGKNPSECHDIFSDFPESSEDIPRYVDQLESVLKNSGNIHERRLAIKFLGKIGMAQVDSSSKVFHILVDTLQNEDEVLIKEEIITNTTNLVLFLSSEELVLEWIGHLLVFIEKEGPYPHSFSAALRSLRNLMKKYSQYAFFTIENLFKIVSGEFKEETLKTPENQIRNYQTKENGGLSSFFRKFRSQFPNTKEDSIRQWKSYGITNVGIKIMLQSPPAIQEEIGQFVKDIFYSPEYSQTLKGMAFQFYGHLNLRKLDQFTSQ